MSQQSLLTSWLGKLLYEAVLAHDLFCTYQWRNRMRKNPWVTIAMMLFPVMVVFLLTGICTAVESQPGPAVFYPEKVFDFGIVLEGQEVAHDFVVQNRGSSELLIQNVKPG
jgi:hypothetical protein